MELKQHLIHRKYQKAEAGNQVTIGEDYSIPEGKPDVAKILLKKAELEVEEVHAEKGKMKIRGKLNLKVFYLAERSSKIADCIETEFPFEEILYVEGASTGDHLKLDWSIEDFKVSIIHPGKLSIRALVNLWAVVSGTEECRITEQLEGDSQTYTKTEPVTMAEPVFERKDSYRIRDEIVLPVNKPNVQNVLWKDLQLRGLELRIQEEKLAVKGEVWFLVIYEGEEESGGIQWLEQSVPFHGILEVPGLTQEMFGLLESEIGRQDIELKPDYDGEMRMFQIEMLLDIHMHLYEERVCNILKDAYQTKEQLVLNVQETAYEKLRMCQDVKCRINGKQTVEEERRILQILGQQAQLQGKSSKVTAQGIVRSGNLEVQILYVTADDRQPFGCVTVNLPYSQLIEIPDMKKEDQWRVNELLEQTAVSMPQSNQIEVRAVIGMNACVLEQCKLNNITGVTAEAYDLEAYKKSPGMVIHFVQPKENLWEIAKKNRTTVEEIRRLNELSAEEVAPGQKLLLLKPSMEAGMA